MRKLLSVILIVFTILGLGLFYFYYTNYKKQKESPKTPYNIQFIEQFDALSIDEQAVFINSLETKEQRISFIAKYLEDHLFAVYPVSYVKFFADGEFIFDGEADKGGMRGGNIGDESFRYFVGTWSYDQYKIIINNPDSEINIFGKYLVLDDIKADTYKNQSIKFIFNIVEGINQAGEAIKFYEMNLWDGTPALKAFGISPSIDKYTRLKQIKD